MLTRARLLQRRTSPRAQPFLSSLNDQSSAFRSKKPSLSRASVQGSNSLQLCTAVSSISRRRRVLADVACSLFWLTTQFLQNAESEEGIFRLSGSTNVIRVSLRSSFPPLTWYSHAV